MSDQTIKGLLETQASLQKQVADLTNMMTQLLSRGQGPSSAAAAVVPTSPTNVNTPNNVLNPNNIQKLNQSNTTKSAAKVTETKPAVLYTTGPKGFMTGPLNPPENILNPLYSQVLSQAGTDSMARIGSTNTTNSVQPIMYSATSFGPRPVGTVFVRNSSGGMTPFVNASVSVNPGVQNASITGNIPGLQNASMIGNIPGVQAFDNNNSINYQMPFNPYVQRRKAPVPLSYDLNSTADFNTFTANFERYCSIEYGIESYEQWGIDLGKFITGELKDVYDVTGGGNIRYSDMKIKLATHVHDYTQKRQQLMIQQYNYVTINPSETLHIYALRLQHLFETLYPDRDINSELPTKFLTSIPRAEAIELEKELNLVKMVSLTPITWQGVLNLVKHRDSTLLAPHTPSAQGLAPGSSNASRLFFSSNGVHGWNPNPAYDETPLSNNRSKNQHSGKKKDKAQDIPRCGFCHKLGHDYDHCRARLKQCLVCGDSRHKTLECPQYKGPRKRIATPISTPQSSPTRQVRNNVAMDNIPPVSSSSQSNVTSTSSTAGN